MLIVFTMQTTQPLPLNEQLENLNSENNISRQKDENNTNEEENGDVELIPERDVQMDELGHGSSTELDVHLTLSKLIKTSYITLDFGSNPPQKILGASLDVSFTV